MAMTVHPSLCGGPLDKSALAGLAPELAFPLEEYRERVGKVRAAMEEAGIDVLLAQEPANVLYLSGYQTFSVLAGETFILPAAGEPSLIVPPPELGTALVHTWLERAYGFEPERSAGAYLAARLADQGLDGSRIGVDKASVGATARCLEDLAQSAPRAKLVDASGLIGTVKAIKSPREIDCLRAAAPMTDAGMSAGIAAIEPGRSDNDVGAAAAHAMTAAGSEYMCVSPIVTTGARSGILHSTHKRIALDEGDPICIEIGACYQRYTTPLMRTATIGSASGAVQRLADACLRALDEVLSALRPGLTGHEVAQAGWKGIAAAGSDLVFHGTFGYGVGVGLPPSWSDGTGLIKRDQHIELRPGMVFHHPVAVRRLGEHGVMFSETTVVTEHGCEVLGNTERKLFVV